MVLPDPNNCTHALIVGQDVYIKLGASFQLLISILTIIPFILIANRRPKSLSRLMSLAHTNLKLVFCTGIIFTLGHPILICLFKLFTLLRSLMANDACDYRWDTLVCLSFKVPIYWTVFGFSCCHLTLFIDRFLATYYRRLYAGRLPGVIMFVGTFALATLIVYLIYRQENINLPRAYCSSTSANTTEILGQYMKYMTIADLLITLGDFGLWIVNRMQLKRRFRKSLNYNLDHALKLKENNLSLQVVFPLSLVHSSCFLTVFIIILINRQRFPQLDPNEHVLTLEFNHSIICLYVLVIVCNLLFLLKRLDKEPEWLKQSTIRPIDAHFQQLDFSFRSAPPRKLTMLQNFSLRIPLPT